MSIAATRKPLLVIACALLLGIPAAATAGNRKPSRVSFIDAIDKLARAAATGKPLPKLLPLNSKRKAKGELVVPPGRAPLKLRVAGVLVDLIVRLELPGRPRGLRISYLFTDSSRRAGLMTAADWIQLPTPKGLVRFADIDRVVANTLRGLRGRSSKPWFDDKSAARCARVKQLAKLCQKMRQRALSSQKALPKAVAKLAKNQRFTVIGFGELGIFGADAQGKMRYVEVDVERVGAGFVVDRIKVK
jgi:hypothetical protein